MHIILRFTIVILITAIILFLITKIIRIYQLNKFRYQISIGNHNTKEPIYFKMQIITRKGRVTKTIFSTVKICTPCQTNKHHVFIVVQDPTKAWHKNISRTVPINSIYPKWAISTKL